MSAAQDKSKTRKIGMDDLRKLLNLLEVEGKSAEQVMEKLDVDKDGNIDEGEWLEGLDRVQTLKAALEKDLDPKTGKLKILAP